MSAYIASLSVASLPLHAVLRQQRGIARKPVAVFDESHSSRAVLHCTQPARDCGVEIAMPISQAIGRCPELYLVPRDFKAEHAADRILRDAAWALAPGIECICGGHYRIDLTGQPADCWLPRAEGVLSQLAETGLPGRMGIATSPGIAQLAAELAAPLLWVEDSAEFLGSIPMEGAPIEPALRDAFMLWGLGSLADAAAFSRQALGDRLGSSGVELWDILNGRDHRPLQPVSAEVDWSETQEPEWPVETVDSLLFLLRRMLESIHMRLSAHRKVVRRLQLSLRFEDRTYYRHTFCLPEPTAAVATIFAMLDNHLQDLSTPSAIAAVRLRCDPIEPLNRQLSFFESTLRNPARFADTLAQLIGIVGSDSVGSPRLGNSHRDDSWELQPLADRLVSIDGSPASPALALRRQRPPLPAVVTTVNRRPSHLRSAICSGSIHDSRGPWQTSGDWWTASPWWREEWDVQIDDGTLCRLTYQGDRWWLDGIYD